MAHQVKPITFCNQISLNYPVYLHTNTQIRLKHPPWGKPIQDQNFQCYFFHPSPHPQRNWWHVFNGVMVLLFVGAVALRLVSIVLAVHHGGFHSAYATECRDLWPAFDPMLVSEAVFCIASVLAFAKILWMFQVRCCVRVALPPRKGQPCTVVLQPRVSGADNDHLGLDNNQSLYGPEILGTHNDVGKIVRSLSGPETPGSGLAELDGDKTYSACKHFGFYFSLE